jgi:hypothetical protein
MQHLLPDSAKPRPTDAFSVFSPLIVFNPKKRFKCRRRKKSFTHAPATFAQDKMVRMTAKDGMKKTT